MKKIKLEHIERLSKWKKSGINIGSRAIPHHLYEYERKKYEFALKKWFLNISEKERVNLTNIWEKVCIAKWQDCIIFEKSTNNTSVKIYKNTDAVFQGSLEEGKKYIKNITNIHKK